MKKALIAFLLFSLVGCAFIADKKADIAACVKDTQGNCFETQVAKSKDLGNKAADLASLSGIPAAPSVAKPIVSYISLLIFLCAAGATLRKKEA